MLKQGRGFMPSGGGGMTTLDPGSIDLLARRIAYYQKDAVITSNQIGSAYAHAASTAYRQGRG